MADPSMTSPVVRVVWGTGTGPTDLAAYDAALADAGVHNYNLVGVSSVIPPSVPVEAVGTAPDLGPAGNRLTVVQSRAAIKGPGRATAGIGWATGDGPGVIYEAAGEFDEATARNRIETGLAAAGRLREAALSDPNVRVATFRVDEAAFGAAVALAVFGRSEPIL